MSCNQQLESYLKNENFPVRRALNAATPRPKAGSFCRPLKSLAEFSCLRLLFDVEPPHGDGVGHEGDGLNDHARVRAREDVIREPERRIGQVKQTRAACTCSGSRRICSIRARSPSATCAVRSTSTCRPSWARSPCGPTLWTLTTH